VPKTLVELVCVLHVNLVIPPNIVKQHLLETFFHLEVGEMMIDETFVWEQVQDLTIACWTIIEEEQLTKITLGTEKSVQHVKVNVSFELIRCHRTID
jgi:nucleosome binding factor SPN SPT16 subunit